MAGPIIRAVAKDLDDDVRGLEYVAPTRQDLSPPGRIVGVRITGLRAGSRLHDDLESRLQEARDDRRHHGHSPLTRVALARYADDHVSTPRGWASAPRGRPGPLRMHRIRVRASARTPRRARARGSIAPIP